MKNLFRRKLKGYVYNNPDNRWWGFYKVKYKGKWIVCEWSQYDQGNKYDKTYGWHWQFPNNHVETCDNCFDKIIEKRIKDF